MQTNSLEAENQHNYDRLMVALETSQGKLDLLIAVYSDCSLQADIIERYETELRQLDVRPLRVVVGAQNPSLRLTLARLVERDRELQAGRSVVVTVQGVETLTAGRSSEVQSQSQQEEFLGYLQWTREAFRRFYFPVVLWVPEWMLTPLIEQSPDFWSWRGGVFWFGVRPGEESLLERIG